jgi:hypothetical protein
MKMKRLKHELVKLLTPRILTPLCRKCKHWTGKVLRHTERIGSLKEQGRT